MKKYRNTSNRHLQFALAGIELAPGQEVELADSVVKNDPGFDSCLERGFIEDMSASRRSKVVPKASDKTSTDSGKKGSSKSDLFEPKDGQQPESTGSDSEDE